MTREGIDLMLRRPEVELLTGRSRSSIYRDVRLGLFPAPVRIGRNAVGWRTSVVEAWLRSRTPDQLERSE
jgi:prophage regulatory protein